MAAMKKLVNQSLKQLIQPGMTSSHRVVSTSPRTAQSLTADPIEAVTMGQCPFKKTLNNFNEAFNSSQPIPAIETKPAVQPFESIPGPKGLPLIGTLYDYIKKDGLKFSKMFEVLRQRSIEYGPIFYEKVGAFHSVVISNPEVYNRLVQSEGKYPNRRQLMPVVHYRETKGLDLGLVNSQGEEWYKQRTVVSKKMLRLNEVASFRDQMALVSDDFVTRLNTIRQDNGEVPQLQRELFKWAMESIGTLLFEERIGCLKKAPSPMAQSFIENMEGFFKTLQPLMYNLPIYKLWKTKTYKEFENYTDNMMDIGHGLVEKKISELQSGQSSAFLKYLFENSSMSTKEITGLVVDLLTAAVETTSTATTWSLYLLAKHPDVQQRLYEEIQAASGPSGEPLSAHTLGSLPYVKAVLKETLRLYPITYTTSRNISEDIELAGYHVPSGTHVQANLFGMYHDPALFEEPEEFKPERWLRSEGNSMDPKVKAISNLVWGHGARMCVGRRIAEQEIHLTLSKIVQNFELSHPYEDVEPILNTMLTPDRPVRLHLTPRQH